MSAATPNSPRISRESHANSSPPQASASNSGTSVEATSTAPITSTFGRCVLCRTHGIQSRITTKAITATGRFR